MIKIPGLLPGHEKAIFGALAAGAAAAVAAYGPDSGIGKLCVVIGAILTTLAGVYQIKNTGYAPVKETVDAVKSVVADDVAEAVTQAVSETTTGVLKDVA